MSELIRKEHDVSIIMCHIVCPAKYRRAAISPEVDKKKREVCQGIEARYEIKFLEMGTEKGHAHFLVQSAPTYSIPARKMFEAYPEVERDLWGGGFGPGGVM
jgi:REP element-mobilizing transposase RayT